MNNETLECEGFAHIKCETVACELRVIVTLASVGVDVDTVPSILGVNGPLVPAGFSH